MANASSHSHTGLTVPSLELGLLLFHEALGLPISRGPVVVAPPTSRITGHPNAQLEIQAVFLTLPDGHTLELLDYGDSAHAFPTSTANPPAGSLDSLMPWHPGCWHLCLTVADFDATVRRLEALPHWSFRAMAPASTICAGPNAGNRVIYLRSFGEKDNYCAGCVLELFGLPSPPAGSTAAAAASIPGYTPSSPSSSNTSTCIN